MPSFTLEGDVALVTGAASGIGRAIAIGIAEQGGRVGLVDLVGADFSSVIAEVESAGGRALAVEADVTSPDDMAEAVARIERDLGDLSLAVNAAGIANASPAEDMPLAQWQKVYDIDVTGVFLSCQAEGRAMLAHGRGSIVNIASMSGTIVNRGLNQVHYNSAKAAVQHLSKSLAIEWATRGVRVNSVSPGYTATPMNLRPEMVDHMAVFASETPMQRVAEPHEIAGPTVFLLSGAASFVTGTDLLVDGGFCAW
ncbi:SDR family oxidoreductase [Frigoribacterium sp. VKM Ac-2530]|uniref:SDR family oxidoreductase n=1 Tax=Frigoribacterium sp. VKM Ac-2530 TaxID=2783822 RepID=UPI00188D7E06|nr:SDR family oxidoreductase [Frigoribacterium sp. VKM Ac-2530]MBF4580582.1 SDR family oxidoreductase [Frigoribacterium sp. VKM Ac-2530]